jgi:putative tricarboxylic transport membrane protein
MAREGEATTRPSDAGTPGAMPEGIGEVEIIDRRRSPAELARELVVEIALLVGAVYVFFLAGTFEFQERQGQLGPGFWPRMAAIGLAAAVLVRIVQTIRERNQPIVHVKTEFDEYEEEAGTTYWSSVGLAMALAVGYVISTMFLGYLFSTALFLTVFIWLGGQRKWYVPLVAIAGTLVLTYLFIGVVYVSLPTGVGVFDAATVAIYNLLGIQ